MPVTLDEFYEFLDRAASLHEKINVSLGDLPPQTLGIAVAKLGDVMASIYTSTPAGREAFEQLMVSGQGKFTHSTLANLTNAFIREGSRQTEEARELREAPTVQHQRRTTQTAP